jgi:1-deoxy-D-xylulose-5-phosphate reductoisomerase
MDDIFGSHSESEQIKVAIAGSTGSVGRQALEVIRSHPDHFQVVALTAHKDSVTLLQQAEEFDVRVLGLVQGDLPELDGVETFVGPESSAEVAAATEASVVLNAVVGAAGLKTTLATIAEGKSVALANKESLVAAGELVMAKAEPGQIRPVDSEHSALWQLLDRSGGADVSRVFLTGSGGPFRGKSLSELSDATAEEALQHPIWEMGRKITIDSATLMNKGLEVIEAHFLFGFTYDEIEVVIHPEGRMHAIIETLDGNAFAHAAVPDMKIPIQVAFGWPERHRSSDGGRIDWSELGQLTFEAPDIKTFRCLGLAYEAGRKGDTYPAVLNAANEVAVQAFLDGLISFDSIPSIVEETLEGHEPLQPRLDEVLEVDAWARTKARGLVEAS